jgi:hypothetical protein
VNHPPICPKSEHFRQQESAFRPTYWAFQTRGQSIFVPLPLEKQDEYMRTIIAAVAEIEWRKRAERWMRLAERGGYRINFHSNATECLNWARAWRAWGQKK